MAESTVEQKLARLAQASPVAPLPAIPRLPDSFKARLPDLANDIDKFNRDLEEFFKKVFYRR